VASVVCRGVGLTCAKRCAGLFPSRQSGSPAQISQTRTRARAHTHTHTHTHTLLSKVHSTSLVHSQLSSKMNLIDYLPGRYEAVAQISAIQSCTQTFTQTYTLTSLSHTHAHTHTFFTDIAYSKFSTGPTVSS